MRSSTAFLALASARSIHAWGNLGHETVAFIAENLISAKGEAWAQSILNSTSSGYLASVATWADTYRYTAEGKFSAPFHFIDAEDNPPQSCSIDYERDCGATGCVVSAIANYTRRVQQPTVLPSQEIDYAIRWLIHFLGDITQPLHDENLALGGNNIDVTFDSTSTNLHHIWDTNMPEKFVGGYTLADAKTWAANLTAEIKTGKYKKQAASWFGSASISDPQTAALAWATDGNSYVCSVVLPEGEAAVESTDLGGAYYQSAIDTIELQIAKGGYRLAHWLDQIATAQKATSKHRSRRANLSYLDGVDLLPAPRELSKAKLARQAIGWGCDHEH